MRTCHLCDSEDNVLTTIWILGLDSGVMVPLIEKVTAQGYDLQFGTNVLGTCDRSRSKFKLIELQCTGHFYFTTLLLPQLLRGTKSSPDGKARVINTLSSSAERVQKIDFDSLRDTQNRMATGIRPLYSQSKLVRSCCYFTPQDYFLTDFLDQGNVVFSNELARRYGDRGIVSVSLNPGNIRTVLAQHMSSVAVLVMVCTCIVYLQDRESLTLSTVL